MATIDLPATLKAIPIDDLDEDLFARMQFIWETMSLPADTPVTVVEGRHVDDVGFRALRPADLDQDLAWPTDEAAVAFLGQYDADARHATFPLPMPMALWLLGQWQAGERAPLLPELLHAIVPADYDDATYDVASPVIAWNDDHPVPETLSGVTPDQMAWFKHNFDLRGIAYPLTEVSDGGFMRSSSGPLDGPYLNRAGQMDTSGRELYIQHNHVPLVRYVIDAHEHRDWYTGYLSHGPAGKMTNHYYDERVYTDGLSAWMTRNETIRAIREIIRIGYGRD
ncbi:hypothetical protein [Lacticaseibacillus kribbianus]|uniref:hypothetical protein n=1 Tax=Lacticaseibacillus kribbianus TaxID=2926292 RepID=UPI001CD634A6|nr:hypothetical protein [Lacticaseibacillus kribbianus]